VSPLWVKGGRGRQPNGTAGLPPVPEIPVRSGTHASCHQATYAKFATNNGHRFLGL
jgi:hypothetical protein